MTEEELTTYKAFIEACVEFGSSDLRARKLREAAGFLPDEKVEPVAQSTIAELPKPVVARIALMMDGVRDSATHDMLSVLEGALFLDEAQISLEEVQLRSSPFATMHFDYVARAEGDPWPRHENIN